MIQLVFDASTPAQALTRPPAEVGYSQHSSAERAAWGDDKLELVGRHPPGRVPGGRARRPTSSAPSST